MSSYRLALTFLRDFEAIEKNLSPAEEQALDRLLAAIVADPLGIRRAGSFYDPDHPSWLTRANPFVVHYAYDSEADEVVFLNLFRRR